MVEQLTELAAWFQGKVFLQALSVDGGAGVKQGIGWISPATQGGLGRGFGPEQEQGREVGFQLLV